MEAVLIAVITVTGSVVTSIISLLIDKKIRKRKQEKQTSYDIKNHIIFSNIDNLIRNEIELWDCSGQDGHEFIKRFLIKRLQLTKNNLMKLIEYDIETLTTDRCKRLISDFVNGYNGFNDVEMISNYNSYSSSNYNSNHYNNVVNNSKKNNNNDFIDENILHNFNRINFNTTLIIMNYVDTINVNNNGELFYHFLNLYSSFLKPLLAHVCCNIDFLLSKNNSTRNMNTTQIIKKQLENTMKTIEKDSKLEQYIHEIVREHLHIKRRKFLFYFGIDAQIIYCSQYCNDLLHYELNRLIGSSIFALIEFTCIEKMQKYLKKHKHKHLSSITVQILDQQEIPHCVIIFKCDDSNSTNHMYLCFEL